MHGVKWRLLAQCLGEPTKHPPTLLHQPGRRHHFHLLPPLGPLRLRPPAREGTKVLPAGLARRCLWQAARRQAAWWKEALLLAQAGRGKGRQAGW